MRQIALPNGEKVAALGQGTWRMGDKPDRRQDEADALRLGLDLGMSLIDTAEMYADGGAEQVVGMALAGGRRDQAFIVSKVLPSNASRKGTVAACERSLKRLKTDRIDLYLLHWIGEEPFAETLAGFLDLQKAGKIRHFGVSNFDVADLEDWIALAGGKATAANQVLYNLEARAIEFDLIPWQRRHRLPVMAYSPLEIGQLAHSTAIAAVARRHHVSAQQVALAWVLRDPLVIAIPKSADPAHVRQNRGALDLILSPEDMAELDRLSPPPQRKKPLAMG